MDDLCRACLDGDVASVERLAQEPAVDLNIAQKGSLPLHYAAMSRRNGVECCRVLLQARAELAGKTNEGKQAVHLAAENPHGAEILEFLLQAGADVDAKSTASRTPLHFAAVDGIL